jgi:hypothetical protein
MKNTDKRINAMNKTPSETAAIDWYHEYPYAMGDFPLADCIRSFMAGAQWQQTQKQPKPAKKDKMWAIFDADGEQITDTYPTADTAKSAYSGTAVCSWDDIAELGYKAKQVFQTYSDASDGEGHDSADFQRPVPPKHVKRPKAECKVHGKFEIHCPSCGACCDPV